MTLPAEIGQMTALKLYVTERQLEALPPQARELAPLRVWPD